MSSQQQFCLKWNNYTSNMNEVFQAMLLSGKMVDVTVACEGESVKAHKMVLAACSPYFQALFDDNPCKHPIVILKDVRYVDLRAIIDFMYRGEVNVSQDQLAALLKTAEMLKVKGLAEVTEKQARGQPQLQAIFAAGSGKKRSRKRKSKSSNKELGETSETDEESNIVPTTNKRHADARPPSQRLGSQRLREAGDHLGAAGQIEPSRILEQSMATAEVSGENGQEGIIQCLDEGNEGVNNGMFGGENFNQDALMMPGPSSGTQVTRRFVMTEGQKRNLKEYLKKPIAYFDVVIDDWKKSIVWKYFGELAYKDPNSGDVAVLDNERHYCLKCIMECQNTNPSEDFEKSNVCFLSNGTATGNHKNHLRMRHQIVDDTPAVTPRTPAKNGAKSRARPRKSNVMTISVEDIVPADHEDQIDHQDMSDHRDKD